MDENNNLGEINNVMNSMPEEPNNNSKSKGPIIAVIVAILVIVGASVFGIMGAKSKTENFLGLFTDDYMFGAMESLGQVVLGEGKVSTDISLNPELINSIVGESTTPISRLALVSELTTKDMDFSGKSYLDIDSTELVSFKYAKTGEAIGFIIPDLMNENIVVKNENLKELARKLGMTEEEITQVPDQISLEEIMKLANQDKDAEAEKEKLIEILKKYQAPLEDEIENLLIVEKDKTIEINDTAVVTEKHSLPLTEKDGYELVKTLLVVAKDDKELYNTIKEDDEEILKDITFEDWQVEIEKSIIEMDELIASGDDKNIVLEIAAYVKGSDTMAIELSVPTEQMIFRLATLNQKDFYHTELIIGVETEEVKIILETITYENSYEGTLAVNVNSQGVKVVMDILDYSIKYTDETNVEKLDLTKDFVLNDKTEDEINAKFEEISNNITNYSTIIMEKAPESLKALLVGDSAYEDDYYYYDETFDTEYAE